MKQLRHAPPVDEVAGGGGSRAAHDGVAQTRQHLGRDLGGLAGIRSTPLAVNELEEPLAHPGRGHDEFLQARRI